MNALLNVSDLLNLQDGEWVNEGFTARVVSTTPGQGKKPMKALLGDVNDGRQITATLWSKPRINIDQIVEFTGKSISVKRYRGQNEVSVGDKADITPVGGGTSAVAPAAAPPAQQVSHQPAPDSAYQFHTQLKRLALLRLHCVEYAAKTVAKAVEAGLLNYETTGQRAEAIGQTATNLFIEAVHRGLEAKVPAFGVPPPAAPKPVPAPPPPANAVDEDVPF